MNVLAVLKPIWTEKAETASRLRGRIEKVWTQRRPRASAMARTLHGGGTMEGFQLLRHCFNSGVRVSRPGHYMTQLIRRVAPVSHLTACGTLATNPMKPTNLYQSAVISAGKSGG